MRNNKSNLHFTQAHMYNQHTRGMTTTRHNSLVTVESGGRKAFTRDQGLALTHKGRKKHLGKRYGVCKKGFGVCKKRSGVSKKCFGVFKLISRKHKRIRPHKDSSKTTRIFFTKYSWSHLGWHFRMLFQGSKLESQICHVSVIRDVRRSSFNHWVLKELSKMPLHMELPVIKATSIKYIGGTGWCGGVLSWLFFFFITLVITGIFWGVALCILHASFAIPHPSFPLMAHAIFTLQTLLGPSTPSWVPYLLGSCLGLTKLNPWIWSEKTGKGLTKRQRDPHRACVGLLPFLLSHAQNNSNFVPSRGVGGRLKRT